MSKRSAPDSLSNLLAQCALGDQTAFVSLYRATAPKLFGVALRILKREPWAEEALQDSYMKIWRGADRYDPGRGAPMTWMINVVRNQALDLRRRADYRVAEVEWAAANDPRVSGDNPALQAEVSEGLGRLRDCMERLAERQRKSILLIYREGFTPTELARSLEVPVATVKTWVRRGLARVRECLRS